MNGISGSKIGYPVEEPVAAGVEALRREFKHLKSRCGWIFVFGVLLVVCGALAIISPVMTVMTTFVAVAFLGAILIVAGIATIATSLWVGKWSGLLLQLLVGVLYMTAGWVIIDTPLEAARFITLFMAAFFIVMGVFRIVASLVVQFPFWGWALLNGIVTFLLGVIIYHRYPESCLWALGLLAGVEMLFHGWNWIMVSEGLRKLPD